MIGLSSLPGEYALDDSVLYVQIYMCFSLILNAIFDVCKVHLIFLSSIVITHLLLTCNLENN
jgi:hypothetical protein